MPAGRRRTWRRTWLRAPLLALAVLLVLAGAGAVALRVWLSPERVRGLVAAAIERRTGYETRIGALEVGLLSGHAVARDVALTAPGGEAPALTASRLELAFAPAMLLHERVVLRDVSLDGASVHLPLRAVRRADNGRGTGPASGHRPPGDWQVAVERVDVRGARLFWRGREIDVAALEVAGLEGEHPTLRGRAALQGADVAGWTLDATAATGPWRALLRPTLQAWPFDVRLSSARDGQPGPDLQATGTLAGPRGKPAAAARIGLALGGMHAGGTLRLLRRPAPWIELRLDSDMVDADRLAALVASLGHPPAAGGSPARSGSTQATLPAPAGPPRPASAQTAATGPGPNEQGANLAGANLAGANGGGPATTPVAAVAEGALPWRWLGAGQGSLALHVAHLRIGDSQLNDLALQAWLQDRRLIASLGEPGGRMAVSLTADARAALPTLTLSMRPLPLAAGVVRRLQGGSDGLDGDVELVGDLAASGQGWRAVLASLHGAVGASSIDGSLSGQLASALLGVGSGLGRLAAAGGALRYRCVGVHGLLAGGLARLDLIGLRSAHARLDGHGQIVLADGALALDLAAAARMGSLGLSAPLAVGGSVRDPRIEPAPQAPGGRYALTIGGGGDTAGGCDALLAAARESLSGPLPAPLPQAPAPDAGTHRKGLKGLDVLRGLGLLR